MLVDVWCCWAGPASLPLLQNLEVEFGGGGGGLVLKPAFSKLDWSGSSHSI